jgi:hypothetical protein
MMKDQLGKLLKKNQLTEQEKEIVTNWYLKLNNTEKTNILKIVKGLRGKEVGLYIAESTAAKEYLELNVSGIEIIYINPEITRISHMPIKIEEDILSIRQSLGKKIKDFELKGKTKELEGHAKNKNLRITLVPEQGKKIDLVIESKKFRTKKSEGGFDHFHQMYTSTEDYEKEHDNYIVLYKG